jgi:hypothetical protein
VGDKGIAFTTAEHGMWWLSVGLGVTIVVLGIASTSAGAHRTAERAAALFEEVDRAGERQVGTTR